MDPQSTVKNQSFTQALPISELLPGLSGLLTKNGIQSLTAIKQPRPRATMAQSRTTEKMIVRPLTYAEMMPNLAALKPFSPRRTAQAQSSVKKKGWNSSVKIEKKITHTANGQMKNNPVRKVLNFQQPKPKVLNPRPTMASSIAAQTPKFPKPEFRPKKSIYVQAKSTVRISGICNIPETPVGTVKPASKIPFQRVTKANKENIGFQANVIPPTPILRKPIISNRKAVPDTPLSNSGSDASFLQKEEEINEIEAKIQAISEQKVLENIAEISPPISTPFKEYRSVQEYFNNTSDMENSVLCNDNTIMCFDNPSNAPKNDKREESVIISLCDLFNKATVTKTELKDDTELNHLLEREQQIERDIKVIENVFMLLNNMKESQVKSLVNVRQLISNKRRSERVSESDKDKTLVADTKKEVIDTLTSPNRSPIVSRPCSVIRSTKSPTYKIPKKNVCLRKKVICKSMPNVSGNGFVSPVKDFDGKGLNMYMRMKEQMHFLSTPKVNRKMSVPDTPAVTSHNLQKQLDQLYAS